MFMAIDAVLDICLSYNGKSICACDFSIPEI